MTETQAKMAVECWQCWRQLVADLQAAGVTVTENLFEVRDGTQLKLEGTFYAEVKDA